MHGISIAAGAPSINHLFFVDDSLIFCDASLNEMNELRRIFLIYEYASGQSINFAKSAICFSSSTGLQTKAQIHQASSPNCSLTRKVPGVTNG